jgi:hypothetical protein
MIGDVQLTMVPVGDAIRWTSGNPAKNPAGFVSAVQTMVRFLSVLAAAFLSDDATTDT